MDCGTAVSDQYASTSGRPAVADGIQHGDIGLIQEDLDEVVARLRGLMADLAAASWKLGLGIRVIKTKQLWKQRRKADGSPAYTAFEQFCVAELEMSHGCAYELMDLASHYDEQQVRRFGKEKLILLLRVPEADKPAVRRAIEGGASKRVVQRLLREAKATSGDPRAARTTGRKQMPVGRNQRDRGGLRVEVTLDTEMTGYFVTRATMNDERPSPAMSIADDPVAVVKISDRVSLMISLRYDDEGYIVCDFAFTDDVA